MRRLEVLVVREILFRGKRVDNGKWITGFLVSQKHIGDWVNANPIVPKTVGQYTGLTDKNGKKIFEGDIVRHYNFSSFPEYFSLGVIFFDEDACMLRRTVIKQVGGEEYTENANGIAQISKKCVYEVIGNIHDNPELLTEATP